MIIEAERMALDDIIGQQKFIETIKVSIAASRMRGEILPHILLVGPRGSGKSTLVKAIANEIGVNIQTVSFSALRTPSDLEPILTRISEGDIVFIENFDSVKQSHADILTPAMDSFSMDIVIGKGASARNIHLDLPRFTVIATMDSEKKIPSKLRGCFSIYWRMLDYTKDELQELSKRFAFDSNVEITDEAVVEIANHAEGSYRKLTTIMKRSRDFSIIKGNGIIDVDIVKQVFETL
jgi:Holliday junction DNA helicase RuvB